METTQARHTPGPWKLGNPTEYQVDRYARNGEWARIRGASGALVAKVESVHPRGNRQSADFDIEAANARLIAASPDLLEALRQCTTEDGAACWKSREYAEKRIRYIDQIARAAIAKAE